jgi:hypothetical protein
MRVHVSTTGPEPGNWLVAIDDGACEVLPGSVSDPDARLYAASDTGHSILNGALPVADALAGRLLFYEGDPVLLQRFRACFHLGEAS